MRLVHEVVVSFGSVEFSIRIDGTQVLLTQMDMESRAVQVPAARAAWRQVVYHLDDDGGGFCRAKDTTPVVRIQSVQIPRHGVDLALAGRCLDERLRQVCGVVAKSVLFYHGDRRQSSSSAIESAEFTVRFQMNSPVNHSMAVLLKAHIELSNTGPVHGGR